MTIYTTLNRIRAASPCADGWTKLLRSLNKTAPDDEPLPFAHIVESNGLGDALWCCRTAPEHDREWRLYAVWCARRMQHLMTDERSIAALDVAERYANGEATDEEREAAGEAALEAALEASSEAALEAAWAAARAAAWAAAWEAAWEAAGATAGATAGEAERSAQTSHFLETVR